MVKMQENTTILLEVSAIAPGETTSLSGYISLKDALKSHWTGECEFPSNASANCRVLLYSSHDHTNWDTEPIAQWDIEVHGGQTVRSSVALIPDFYYVAAKMQNLDENVTINNCKVRVTTVSP